MYRPFTRLWEESDAISTCRAHRSVDERTRAGRVAFLDRFEREVDPNGTLSPDERKRRADHAKKAYFAGLALKSARARRAKKAS